MMEQLIKADEVALAPFIKRINECIELYAHGRNSGVKIATDLLPRSDKQRERLIKLLHEVGYKTIWTNYSSILVILWD